MRDYNPIKQVIRFILISVLLMFIVGNCISCMAPESLLEHNKYDCMVLGYEYPYYEILSMPDSTIKYKFSLVDSLTPGGYLISEKR